MHTDDLVLAIGRFALIYAPLLDALAMHRDTILPSIAEIEDVSNRTLTAS